MDPLSVGLTLMKNILNSDWNLKTILESLSMLRLIEPNVFELIRAVETAVCIKCRDFDFGGLGSTNCLYSKELLLYQFGFLSIGYIVPCVGPLEKTRPSLDKLLSPSYMKYKYYLSFVNDCVKKSF